MFQKQNLLVRHSTRFIIVLSLVVLLSVAYSSQPTLSESSKNAGVTSASHQTLNANGSLVTEPSATDTGIVRSITALSTVQGGGLTNGATHTGVIQIGGLDTWTIQANQNDGITISIGEVAGGGADPNFVPWIRLRGPDNALLASDSNSNSADIDVRAPLTGTYTVTVASNTNNQVGAWSYVLTVAKTPGPYVISPGDEGGTMTNGATHTGVIGVGDLDAWSFQAGQNEGITLSIGEVAGAGADPNFVPWIRLRGPDGALLGNDWNARSAQIEVRAPLTGTYTLVVASNTNSQIGPGAYVLTLAKTPGPFTVSSGDEGGLMINGATHTGLIGVGDLDPWSFQANQNEGINISIGEVTVGGVDPNFVPWIRLRGPDGALLGNDWNATSAQIDLRAPLSGMYTLVVASNTNSQVGAGSYVLTMAKTPGPYTVSSGDEGGTMTNGATHTGSIGVGDLDAWSFQASQNDGITLSIGEVAAGGVDPVFVPWIRLRGPDGALLGNDWNVRSAQIEVRAPLSGIYTVVVASNTNSQIGPGSYVLTVAKTPGPYTVSPGDEGGPMTNGATHTGLIGVGDLDPWTFQAGQNDGITLSIGEVVAGEVDPNFVPWIRLRGPDGALLGNDWNSKSAEFDLRAPLTGTYTVVVASNTNSQVGAGSYVLTLAKTAGPYTVSSGDEGGPMINGTTHTGVIGIGDLDAWSFQATQNDGLTISIGEVVSSEVDPNFVPWIRLKGPDGLLLGNDWSARSAQIDLRAPLSGIYTVVVASNTNNQVGPGSYVLTMAKTPGPYIVSSGDEGGPMINGLKHTGLIGVGDLDAWSFQANQNEGIAISIGEVALSEIDPIFVPWIRLRGPDGALLGNDWNTKSAELDLRAPLTGTYTVVVASNTNNQVGTGSYLLTLAKTPGPYFVSAGDEGGRMIHLGNNAGTIPIGDLDPWSFKAAANDNIVVSIGEVAGGGADPVFVPWIRLKGPDGASLGSSSNQNSAQLDVHALLTGTYTVLVASNTNNQVGTGSYVLNVSGTAAPAPCVFTLASPNTVVTAGGGSGSIGFTSSESDCVWSATSNAGFINITSASGGVGNGTVSFSVAANTSSISRNGTLTIGGQTFTVVQSGVPCSFSLSAPSQTISASGGTGSVGVTATPGDCGWTASSNASFITITSGATGTGNGSVGYSVAVNPGSVARSGTINIAGQTFTVNQAAPQWEGVVLTPDRTEIKTWTTAGRTSVYLKLSFPNAGYRVVNWGQVIRSGNDFSVDALVERFTGASVQAVTTTAQIYDLGPLAVGTYTFTFKNSGVVVNSQAFVVSSAIPPANPIDDARQFVKQQYRDFLNREADQAGEDFWTDNITKCNDPARRPVGQTVEQCTTRQRETTSGAFFESPEFQYTGYFVYRMYQGALGRQPKLSEFIPDAQFVGDGIIVNGQLSGAKINQNKAAFAQQFVNCVDVTKYRCAEFKAIYDPLSNQQFVDKLFLTTGVNASPADRTALVDGLNGATETRASVVQKIVDGINVISEGNQQFTTTYGQAFYNAEFNRAFVQLEYFGYMRRDPDDGGYAFWLDKLNLFGGNFVNAEMVLAFISSPEYRARFGQP